MYGTGLAGNQAPSVALTSPAAGAMFIGLAPISLTASAADTDGTVSKVEFYVGTTLAGAATASPYAVSWTPPAAGTYSLTAKALETWAPPPQFRRASR